MTSGLPYTFGQYTTGLGALSNSNPNNDSMQPRTEAPGGSESNKGGFLGFVASAGKFIDSLTDFRNAGQKNRFAVSGGGAAAQSKDNTMTYVIIGVVALALIGGLIIYMNKK